MSKLLISKDGFKVQEIELKSGTITLGRAKDNDVQLNDPTVSAHHAKIVTSMRNSYIEDLESKNGVFVNGERVVVQALELEDVISIGQHELFYQEAQLELAVEESLGDAALVASATVGASSAARNGSSLTADISRQISTQEPSSNILDNSLRVVVDNTFKSPRPRPLDIDISFEKFVSKSVSLDSGADALYRNDEQNAGASYVKTHRYFEPPRESADRQPATFESGKGVSGLQSKPEKVHRQSDSSVSAAEKENVNRERVTDKESELPAHQPDTPKLVSKQPFMSSEEVVGHLIALSREKNKGRKKSHGLSTLVTIVTFGLIAAAIYYQLQFS